MRWPSKPRREYGRWFAIIPMETIDGWVWLEMYYVAHSPEYVERWLDPESHYLTDPNAGPGLAIGSAA